MTRIFLLLFTLSVFASCEKEVTNIQLPETKSKLVLGCFLVPSDTVINVTITKSMPIFNNTSTKAEVFVENASVTISDGVNSAILPEKGFGLYQVNSKIFPIIEGKEYTVSASASSYDNVYGKCTVPKSVAAVNASLNGPINTVGSSIELKWQDIPNQNDYYIVSVYGFSVNDSLSKSDTVYNYVFYSDEPYKDNGKDGHEMSISIKLKKAYEKKGYSFKGYSITIFNLEYNYYMYLKSFNKYNNNDPSNPFSEPALVYTNVDKGLGVVGGYTRFNFIKN
ncbi:MAG: DUF4249 domain-containing protein [Bacteroidia bacterium]